MGELKPRAHSYGQNCYHLIWAPKFRIKMLKPEHIRRVCKGIIRMICNQKGFVIHEMEIMSDHIHLFVEIPPSVSVSKAFQYLKGGSSRILRRNFKWLRKFDCLWSKGKFYRSVGNVTSDVIEHYISKCQGGYGYFDVKQSYAIGGQSKLTSF